MGNEGVLEAKRRGNAALPDGNHDEPLPRDLVELQPGYVARHGHTGLQIRLKRVMDVFGSILILVLFSPVWLLMALMIKADSPGPILFRQKRIGRNGEPFGMLKFRTMFEDADSQKFALLHLNEAGDGFFKIKQDPRVTRFGRLLRATSLDELPQILHVLSGGMSLVGPRPLVAEEDAAIEDRYRIRLDMRPGMTGAWQVAGASQIPIAEMARLDYAYVVGWSLLTDLKLLAMTIPHVVKRRGM